MAEADNAEAASLYDAHLLGELPVAGADYDAIIPAVPHVDYLAIGANRYGRSAIVRLFLLTLKAVLTNRKAI